MVSICYARLTAKQTLRKSVLQRTSSISLHLPAGRLNFLRRHRKWTPDALFQQNWFVFVRDAWIHNRTVAESANAGSQTLQGVTPTHLSWCAAMLWPEDTSIQPVNGMLCFVVGRKVNESMTQGRPIIKTAWQVKEIILASKTFPIQNGLDHFTGTIRGDVPNHNCRAFTATSTSALRWHCGARMLCHGSFDFKFL